MRSLILLTLLIVFCPIHGQKKLSETEKLFYTAKVWGFLKYHHPKVTSGELNWDEQLEMKLPEIYDASNIQELSKIYSRWIKKIGNIEECLNCTENEEKEYFLKNYDLSWFQKSGFSETLIKHLEKIKMNKVTDEQHYVAPGRVGQVDVVNEEYIASGDWKISNKRLITLFRYWNIIEYFFPYKYQITQNWNDVLKEMIPRFIDVDDELAFHLLLLELIVNIDDSHGRFSTPILSEYFGNSYLPVDYELVEGKVIVTAILNEKLATNDDLQIGDIIESIDGKSPLQIHKENLKYINASNEAVKGRYLRFKLFRGIQDSCTITINRRGETLTKTVNLYSYNETKYQYPDNKWSILDDNIGYVNMGILEQDDVVWMMDELRSTKAIIFDIRNYPRGTMYKIALYLNSQPTEFVKFTKPDFSSPGKFFWTDILKCGGNKRNPYSGKVILLVNEKTQSHAEFTCMCLQTAENSIIIGSQTSGADGNVERFEIIGGSKTIITGIGVFYPDGRETQRIGIVPDIEVKKTIKGIQNGEDEVLNKAIEVANY